MNKNSTEETGSIELNYEEIIENKEHENSSHIASIPIKIFTPPIIPIGKNVIKRNQMADEVMKSMLNRQEKRHKFHIFREHIVCKIRKLPTDVSKNTVQHLINNILYDAELGKYNNSPQKYNFIMPYSQPLQTFNKNQPQSVPPENVYQSNASSTSLASSSITSYNISTPTITEE